MCEHGGFDNRDLLGMLDAAADMLRAAGRIPLSGALADVELTQAVQKLEAVARIAQGRKCALIDEIAQRDAHRGQAAASTSDLLARVLHLAPGEARAQAELAEGLRALPDTAKALADGRIGISQATVTVHKAAEVRDREDAEELLAKIDATASTAGQTLDRNRLAREIDTTVARAGVDVLAQRERTAHARRRVDITTRDGMTVVHAELDPVGGAQVRAALDALSRKDGEGDKRSFVQRQADALVTIATRGIQADGIPENLAKRARVLLITLRCAGPRRNRPAALQGTRPRLGLGHPEFAFGRPRRPARHTLTRRRQPRVTRGQTRQACVAGAGPRVLAIRQRAARTGAGRTDVRTRGLGRSRGPASRDDRPRCWRCHTHIHQHDWQITKDTTGRYRAGPPDLVPPHLENSIAIPAHAHTS